MATIKDYEENLKRIEHEIEQNAKNKKGMKEKIQDMLDEIQDLKDDGAERSEIRAAKNNLDKMHKQQDAISSSYYWLREQKRTCENSIAHLKQQGITE